MQTQTRTVQTKTDAQGKTTAKPLPAPVPLSPELLQQVGGAGDSRPLPKGGW